MAKNSQIEWTHHTFNPWWGCAKVSPACENCYAELWAKRMGKQIWGTRAPRRFFTDAHWKEPLVWNEEARLEKERHRVFCASMADVFEDRTELNEQRQRLWTLIQRTPMLDWLLLTKRPENIAAMVPWAETWPRNVWLGTTVENQKYAELRLPHLLKHPAAVRFLSCEPLLGAIDLTPWFQRPGLYPIDWVIAGGESGPGARPMHPDWAGGLLKQCKKARAAFHFKQWGHWVPAEIAEETAKVQLIQIPETAPVKMVRLPKKKRLEGFLQGGLGTECQQQESPPMPKVDFALYAGREQAFIKHCLLEQYLPEWAWKIGSQWDALVYVDGFAGPWDVRSPDFADSSFGIAVNALRSVASGLHDARGKSISIRCVCVEQEAAAFGKLNEFSKQSSKPGFVVEALNGEFHAQVPQICRIAERAGQSVFKFVFLDPKGWSLNMQQMLPLIRGRSCEVVVNLMTRHIIRFLDEEDRTRSIADLLGRPEVVASLRELPSTERPDALVREYCKSLHALAGYEYVSSAAIFDPDKDEIRYFLIYGTNHHRGIEVFKAAERTASKLQDTIRHQAAVRKSGGQGDMLGQLFGESVPTSNFAFKQWEKYCGKAQRKVAQRLLESKDPIEFKTLFCDAMAFPLVTPQDLHSWLEEWAKQEWIEFRLDQSDGGKRKKPSLDRGDHIVVLNRNPIEALMSL